MKKPVIEFRDFGMRYASQQKPTLYDINLTIYEGEKVLILGPSGSGKTTLLREIHAGLLPERAAALLGQGGVHRQPQGHGRRDAQPRHP